MASEDTATGAIAVTRHWLDGIGLGRYADLFAEHRIGLDVLGDLTEADLAELGLRLGDRKRLLRAIPLLRGASQGNAATDAGASAPPRTPAAAERRQLTVMFCDMVGSTALSEQFDPEDLREVITAYRAACARAIEPYDGFVARYVGDGILVYFGYPRAHEDDAERAVRAGLEIVHVISTQESVLAARAPVAVRIGIATGLVVAGDLVGESTEEHDSVVGETPNLAARLQALAPPNCVVIASSTRSLLSAKFEVLDLGSHAFKGLSAPVQAWRVVQPRHTPSRFAATAETHLTPLISREEEIALLLRHWHAAKRGEGQVVLLSGEPGMGKSRLAAAVAERIAGEPHTYLIYQCSPYHANSPLHPFIAQLQRAVGFKEDDTFEQLIDKLETLVATGTSQVQATAPLLAALLSIPFNKRYAPLTLSALEQRQRTLAALLDHLDGLARRQPILLLFEDAHWADATSLELLDLTVARAPQLPILALFTFRPEFEPPWAALPNVSTLSLGRLARSDVESMAARVAGGRRLPAEVLKAIVAKTDGNPLFVEELTKAVLESGILVEDAESYRLDGPLPPLAIPATLRDSLMARLDRLKPMKEIGQIGSVIGREFSYSLLRAVVGWDETELMSALDQLEQAALVLRQGAPPRAVYAFKHALVRDAAYGSLLKSSRQRLHQQIARAIEEGFPGIVANEPEIVAHHFTEAHLIDSAIDYWLQAGNLALSRSANAEAVEHLRRGIELTRQKGPSRERVRMQLDFYLALGPALAVTEGYAAPETLSAFSHARELLGDGGTLAEQMTVLWGAYLAHNRRAEHIASLEVARQCLALAEVHQHAGMSALAHRFMGQTLNIMGALADARHHLERTIVLCTANEETIAAYRKYGIDDQVGAMFNLARALLLLGYPDQSAAETERFVSRARTLSLPFTTALALSHAALVGVLSYDMRRVAAHVDDAIAYSVDHRLQEPQQKALFMKGALLAQSGHPQHGLSLMRTAMEAESKAAHGGQTQYLAVYLGHIATAHATLGELELGLDLLDEAIQAGETTEERFFEAELYHLRGLMLLTVGKRGEAEAALRRALMIAEQQQARWWQLRAATTLAKHWQEEGRPIEAYSLLQPIYGWFTEGFDSPVLEKAKELLDELGEPASQRAPGPIHTSIQRKEQPVRRSPLP